jgi:hypothetical protein
VNDVRWVQIDQNPGGAILYSEHSDACLVQMTMPKINLQQMIGAVDIRISIISLLLCLLAGMPLSAMAQTDLDIDVIRQAAEDVFDQVEIGAGYAAIVDFAVSRDISSATFYPDEVDGVVDPKLKNTKVPFRIFLGGNDTGRRPFVQGHFAYQTLESGFDVLPDEFINSTWTTYGVSIAGGIELPFGEYFKLLPVASVGYGRIENRAKFYGPISESLLEPALSELVFNWNANTVVYGASLGADYRRDIGGFDVEILGSLTHHQIESTSASNEFTSIRGHVTAFDFEVNTVHATPWKLGGYPLSIVGLFGGTKFLGPDSDALGFDHFLEAGIGLEGDVSAKGWKVDSLRLGVKAIFGPDVSGWGLILGYGF